MTSARNNIDISRDSSEILCTQEEAELWLCMLKEEYEHKDFILGSSSLNLTFVTKYKIQQLNKDLLEMINPLMFYLFRPVTNLQVKNS